MGISHCFRLKSCPKHLVFTAEVARQRTCTAGFCLKASDNQNNRRDFCQRLTPSPGLPSFPAVTAGDWPQSWINAESRRSVRIYLYHETHERTKQHIASGRATPSGGRHPREGDTLGRARLLPSRAQSIGLKGARLSRSCALPKDATPARSPKEETPDAGNPVFKLVAILPEPPVVNTCGNAIGSPILDFALSHNLRHKGPAPPSLNEPSQ